MGMRLVLLGDGDSPHLLKWARALAAQPGIELWAASSRGFMAGFDACVAAERRLALGTYPDAAGGNVALLRQLPQLARWFKRVDADWIHAHYLTSHGLLAVLARRGWGLRARIAGSAWGSDILVTPQRSRVMRWATRAVLRGCSLTTSDSQVMAARMHGVGAREVMVFPFGLEVMPPPPGAKDDRLFFANRGLEPIYRPERVLAQFEALMGEHGQLVVANEGSERAALEAAVRSKGLQERVQRVGRLSADVQARWYAQARWYLSLPASDSVSVSVIEAMAHGCVPIVSDLPANRELVQDGVNGLVVPEGNLLQGHAVQGFLPRADAAALHNRRWVEAHALFPPAVQRFVARLRALS
jgi:L-malate glycosyltransferase